MKKDIIEKGMNNYIDRINRIKDIYSKAQTEAKRSKGNIYMIEDTKLFNEVIFNLGPVLDQNKAEGDLQKIYDIGFHKKSGALIISNKGATIYSLSEITEIPHLIRHIGFYIYMPGLGIEFVNVGLVGNVYDGKVVYRTESACTPSFMFGSQRCNCHYQWKNIRELAATFNEIKTPKIDNGREFELWVQSQSKIDNGKHLFKENGRVGFILMHMDNQNGMGSGYTKDEFVFDLYERASIRHRGEYTSEQTYNETMAGGFETIGIEPDPRGIDGNFGYKVPSIILDYLGVSKDLIFLTNNPFKIKSAEDAGYKITRVKSIGAVNMAGSVEAEQRGTEFEHFDINGSLVTFKEDVNRIKMEISEIIGGE
jgi:GTP cyclohydrolase II.